MAREAERMLADTGWLPEPLRTPTDAAIAGTAGDASELPAFRGEDGSMPREPTPADSLPSDVTVRDGFGRPAFPRSREGR
jgi:ParB family chromosome partitioning protein